MASVRVRARGQRSRSWFSASIGLFCALTAARGQADVKLPAIFGPHMVLQEDRPLPFWGTASPGETVTIGAAGHERSTKAGPDGRWKVVLPPLTHREPFTVTVAGNGTALRLQDVVTGEVWIGSGQSNMEWTLIRSMGGEAEAERARDPKLRLFQVRHRSPLPPRADDVEGEWVVCDPTSAAVFSAVLFHFGRELRTKLDRPVGLINTSWGGTPAEAWTSEAALAADPQLRVLVPAAGKQSPAAVAAEKQAYEQRLNEWDRVNRHQDAGNQGEAAGWARPGIPQEGWDKITVPGHWEDTAKLAIDGAVWFRKEIDVPASWAGRALTLHLGLVNDCDVAYVGGERVGASCANGPGNPSAPRAYPIPGRLVRPGRLLVAVRVFDERGSGGFSSRAESLYVTPTDAADGPRVPLSGRWNYRIERGLPAITVRWDLRPVPPASVPDPNTPTHLWNQLVAPMVPFAIRGVTWYQGETNVDRAHQYRRLFPALIRDWRRAWGQGDFPFLFVQLANFHPSWPGPGHRSEDEWPELREAQTMTMAAVPNTGMAVTIDIGNRDDIHPTNKREVGRRLSLWALAKTYGQSVPHSGPLYGSHRIERDGVRVTFSNAEGLATADRRSALMGFEVAGSDRRFVHARAVVDGDSVIASAPNVRAPVAVRYGWSDSPTCNLVNAAGLPASPFRTDSWPGLTVGRQRPLP